MEPPKSRKMIIFTSSLYCVLKIQTMKDYKIYANLDQIIDFIQILR